MTILTAQKYANNGELIENAGMLGYLPNPVLDVTYGEGVFWSSWVPGDGFTKHDLKLDGVDFRHLPEADRSFATVVFDPPYRLRGTPALGEMDERYGTTEPATADDVMELMTSGLRECCRVADRYVLCKCQDQVVSGRKVWQTTILSECARDFGFQQWDRLDYLHTPRPQPIGRQQIHSQTNYSTLLIFRRRGK